MAESISRTHSLIFDIIPNMAPEMNILNSNNCIFCKIVAKQIPAEIVYEDADFLAFLSIQPMTPGHTLIIPKQHYRWVWDVPEGKAGAYFEVARKVALAQKKAFDVEMVLSKIVGEEVPHAHIWIYPDKAADLRFNKADLTGNAARIRKTISAAITPSLRT